MSRALRRKMINPKFCTERFGCKYQEYSLQPRGTNNRQVSENAQPGRSRCGVGRAKEALRVSFPEPNSYSSFAITRRHAAFK
eukprot:810786-Amorphochlora_amoeboformis.AAC.1